VDGVVEDRLVDSAVGLMTLDGVGGSDHARGSRDVVGRRLVDIVVDVVVVDLRHVVGSGDSGLVNVAVVADMTSHLRRVDVGGHGGVLDGSSHEERGHR